VLKLVHLKELTGTVPQKKQVKNKEKLLNETMKMKPGGETTKISYFKILS